MRTQRSTPTPRRGAATLQQVADAAGVSLATASRVLNGSTRTVNPELSEHVKEVAARLRYVSHGPAQALARATTSLVGLLVHDVNDPYFSAIAAGAMRVARERDLLVMVANTYRDPDLELDYITRLDAQRARAILVAGSPPVAAAPAAALRERLVDYVHGGGRVVSIGDQGPDIDAVLPENAAGGRAAALHLAGLGHREIGVVTGPAGLVTVADRLEGFTRGLLEAGGDIHTTALQGDFTRDGGYQATRRLLEKHPKVTAVFALSDLMAVGALAALREAGRRVPDDVSLIGFDDLAICADLTPALTTVRVDTEGMGEQAMRMVVAAGPEAEAGPDADADADAAAGTGAGDAAGDGVPADAAVTAEQRTTIQSPTELIVRGSTGPAVS
ncbi:LacI family DNA-binding transcriptional regulator [Catenulispora subtropica]|uniref:LacI family DNA-binding transcriptional regulator n=1 Tax=Catenulispora subtropica TaxID=450798 RepID=A0ABN2QGA8_9ACTN